MVTPGTARIQEGNTKADKAKSGLVGRVHSHTLTRSLPVPRHPSCPAGINVGLVEDWDCTEGRMRREGGSEEDKTDRYPRQKKD